MVSTLMLLRAPGSNSLRSAHVLLDVLLDVAEFEWLGQAPALAGTATLQVVGSHHLDDTANIRASGRISFVAIMVFCATAQTRIAGNARRQAILSLRATIQHSRWLGRCIR